MADVRKPANAVAGAEQEEKSQSPLKFAAIFFGMPMLVVILYLITHGA